MDLDVQGLYSDYWISESFLLYAYNWTKRSQNPLTEHAATTHRRFYYAPTDLEGLAGVRPQSMTSKLQTDYSGVSTCMKLHRTLSP